MKIIRILVEEGGFLPTKGTPDSACWDLYSPTDVEIASGKREVVELGIRLELNHCAGIVSHRSGMNAESGVQIYGVIDPDYRGIIKVTIYNWGYKKLSIKRGDRIAQIRFVDVAAVSMKKVDKIGNSMRGECGYGSTGS